MCTSNSQYGASGCVPQQCGPQGEQYRAGGCGGAGCTLGAGCLQWGPGHPGYYPSVEAEKEKKDAAKTWQDTPVKKLALPESVEVEKEKKDAAKTWQDTPVKKLALPEMVKTFLIKSNIKKVKEIKKKSDKDLLDVKGIGETALKLIREAVRKVK